MAHRFVSYFEPIMKIVWNDEKLRASGKHEFFRCSFSESVWEIICEPIQSRKLVEVIDKAAY